MYFQFCYRLVTGDLDYVYSPVVGGERETGAILFFDHRRLLDHSESVRVSLKAKMERDGADNRRPYGYNGLMRRSPRFQYQEPEKSERGSSRGVMFI